MGEIQKPTSTEVQIIIGVSDCRLCSHNILEARQLSWNNAKLGIKKARFYFCRYPVVWPRASHFITLRSSALFLPFSVSLCSKNYPQLGACEHGESWSPLAGLRVITLPVVSGAWQSLWFLGLRHFGIPSLAMAGELWWQTEGKVFRMNQHTTEFLCSSLE